MSYLPANLDNWQGRADSLAHERYFQRVKALDLRVAQLFTEKQSFAVLGFACDEGIRRNLGRVGAAQGPQILRKELSKLACHLPIDCLFYDAGDIVCDDQNLALAQQELGQAVHKLRTQNLRPLLIGGGHEMAFGHYLGLAEPEIAIINFDAHYDLRPSTHVIPESSGTPFRQIAEHRKRNNLAFDYTVIGIQPSANTKSLISSAKELGVNTIKADQIHRDLVTVNKNIEALISDKKQIYLSICLDVFAASYAPGVSAPQALGLSPWQVWHLLETILRSNKVISIDIAELSPPLDRDYQTAKLAAELIASITYSYTALQQTVST